MNNSIRLTIKSNKKCVRWIYLSKQIFVYMNKFEEKERIFVVSHTPKLIRIRRLSKIKCVDDEEILPSLWNYYNLRYL